MNERMNKARCYRPLILFSLGFACTCERRYIYSLKVLSVLDD